MADQDKVLIHVIGIDRLRHFAEPHKDTTECGVRIWKKQPTVNDLKQNPFSCYPCTY